MEELESPRIEVEEDAGTYARIVAEPLEPGFGTTVGNALRRVLLSSLPGAAVTSVRIDGVEHEFSTIPHVKEDVTELILNLKEIRLRPITSRPVKMYLDVSGEGEVLARHIQEVGDYEIVNPDLHIATLDSAEAHLSLELSVEMGRGYVPSDQSENLPIGVIPLDCVFTPVVKVSYSVEPTRLGQASSLDKLTLEAWTDGSMGAVDAISESAAILNDRLRGFVHLGRPEAEVVEKGLGIGPAVPPEKYNTPIEDLKLSVRAYNCLKRSGLTTVGQVLAKSEDELLSLRNFGRKSYDELRERLIELGYLEPEPEMDDEEGEEDEDIGSLGAALKEALKRSGSKPIGDEDEEEEEA